MRKLKRLNHKNEMARTISEIYNAIISEKQNQTELTALQPAIDNSQTLLEDLTSTSKVEIWRLIFWVTSVAIWSFEKIMDQFKAEVEATADSLIVGTDRWLQLRALEFQLGDQLQFIDEKYQYSVIDETKKIIKTASVITQNSQVVIKVAKDDGSGGLEPLTSSELQSFNAYMLNIAPAGTNMGALSIEADDVLLSYDIVYNPLILASNGESLSSPGTFPVEDAINAYIQGLPFDGVLNLTKLTDAIQQVEGVNDPVLNSAQAKPTYQISYATLNKNYVAIAGYMALDPTSSFNYQLTNV